MREALASVLSGLSSLQEDDYRERPVDRLHALAAGGNAHVVAWLRCDGDIGAAKALAFLASLGKDLFALKAGRAESYRQRCNKGLYDALMWPENRLDLRPASARLVVNRAILEWLDDKCVTCRGKGVIPDVSKMGGQIPQDGAVPMKECPACHGTVIRRYSEDERAETLGDNPKRLYRALETAHGLIGEALKQSARNYFRLSTQ